MSKPPSKNPLKHLKVSDLRSAVKLTTTASQAVANMAEGVHQSVWGTMGLGKRGSGQTGGITGLVYRSVRGAMQLVGSGLHSALAKLEPYIATPPSLATSTPEREAVLAALNGVLGDHLAASESPLATRLTLRYQGQALDWQTMPSKRQVTGKVLIIVHGLCMNDLQWADPQPDVKAPLAADITASPALILDHGQALADALGYTPVYVRYNTGLHTSDNGELLSQQLDLLAANWPKAITEITVLVHSMGGLVIRSAVHTAQSHKAAWCTKLQNIVFLGTPHHGAPLEKAGNWIDVILGSTPYSKPFAKLGQLRSSGITDLRFGNVLNADWRDQDRFQRKSDNRTPLPLPAEVACYCVAATVASKRSLLAERILGDGLVPLPSALGQHNDPARKLQFLPSMRYIAYRTNHMQLLHSPEVRQQLIAWLTPRI